MSLEKSFGYRSDIQVLRGLAVIAVVGYHLDIPGFKNGFLGVDLFFVISGFLMAAIYKTGNIREFYSRRANRLFPAFIATIFATILVGFLRVVPSDFIQITEQSKFAIGLIPNFYFWSQDSYFASANFNPLLHLWSLGVEFQFYLILPILVFFFKKIKASKYFIFFVSAGASLAILQISPKTAFFILPFRVWEFVAGMIAFDLLNRQKKNYAINLHKYVKLIVPLAVIGIFLFLPVNGFSTSYLSGHPGLGALLVSTLAGIYLISAPGLPHTKWLEAIGKYSYSIYLVHFPLIVFFQYKAFGGTILAFQKPIMIIFQILLITLLSIAMYHFIELHFRFKAIQLKVWILVLLLSALCISNMPNLKLQQLATKDRNIVEARFDRTEYRCGKWSRILNPTAKVCIVGQKDLEKKVLLLGNSHADALKTSFTSMANQNGKVVYFWVQNNPLMSDISEDIEVANIVRSEEISEVYLHFSAGAVKLENILALKNQLNVIGVKLKVLGPIPTWTAIVPAELWRLRNSNSVSSVLVQDYQTFAVANNLEINFFKQQFSEGSTFFDLGKIMCQPNCAYQDSFSRPLYWDSGHLTLTGAKMLESVLKVATAP
jgi:peptidoglycan/LPS O-acetylase OafA/YrhL